MKGYETIPSALFAVNFCKWTNTVEILTFLMEQGIINPYTQFTLKKTNVDSLFTWLLVH